MSTANASLTNLATEITEEVESGIWSGLGTGSPTSSASSANSAISVTKHSSTSAADGKVTITLPPAIYAYFKSQAEADERSLAKYLERRLRAIYDADQEEV